jgi:hypothetical protein
MLRTVEETLESLFSPKLYVWVAHRRHGLEMLHSFIVGMYISIIGFIIIIYNSIANHGALTSYVDLALAQGFGANSIASDPFLHGVLYLVTVFLFGFSFSFYVTMSAIMYAIVGQVFNYLLNARLDFCQMVRISVHALIASTIVCLLIIKIAVVFSLGAMFLKIGILSIFTGYMILAVWAAKCA